MEHAPTLLVVDDEPVIRASLADALQEAGFNVIDSPTGEQALEELATPGIAGIVTDIRLGAGLNGWDVARHARRLHPRIAVLYITGDSAIDWASEGVTASVMIQKPFAAARIVTTVSDLLRGPERLLLTRALQVIDAAGIAPSIDVGFRDLGQQLRMTELRAQSRRSAERRNRGGSQPAAFMSKA